MFSFFEMGDLVNGSQASLSNKFILEIGNIDVALIDGVSRPGYKIETEQHQILEYQINFPKTIKFDNTITFNIIELLDPEIGLTQMQTIMSELFDKDRYITPSTLGIVGASGNQNVNFNPQNITFNLSKKNLLYRRNGIVSIHVLDADGKKYDSIKLINAMITAVAPSALKYSSDEVNKIAITMTFDYADYGRGGAYNYGTALDYFRKSAPAAFTAARDLKVAKLVGGKAVDKAKKFNEKLFGEDNFKHMKSIK